MAYDIDSTECSKRIVCWYVKNSVVNVAENQASKIDKILNGLTSSEWSMHFVQGTAIEEAINTARNNENCQQTFSSCKISPKTMELFVKRIIRQK